MFGVPAKCWILGLLVLLLPGGLLLMPLLLEQIRRVPGGPGRFPTMLAVAPKQV